MTTPSLTSELTPPDIIRSAYAELVVTDLAASREFYVDMLGLVVTYEDENAIYLRAARGVPPPHPRAARRARSPRGRPRLPGAHPGRRRPAPRRTSPRSAAAPSAAPAGAARGIGDAVRVEDPLGFPFEFFYDGRARRALHPPLRRARRRRHLPARPLQHGHPRRAARASSTRGPRLPGLRGHRGRGRHRLRRLDVPQGHRARRRPHRRRRARACTTSRSPPTRSTRSCTSATTSAPSAQSDAIERGPGRHGVSNAFYLYLRDPDGHRIEIYTQRLLHRRPGQPGRHLGRARQPAPRLVGQPGRAELVHRGDPRARPRRRAGSRSSSATEPSELAVTIGADGFSYTRKDDTEAGFKLGHQL